MIKEQQLIIIGNSTNARLVKSYFEHDSQYEPVAFAVDEAFVDGSSFCGLPQIALADMYKLYKPADYVVFVAIGYSQMNEIRKQKYLELKSKGYIFASYRSSKCTFLTKHQLGENVLILEDNTIQENVLIGNNVVLWSGNHIGHDVRIEDHAFISSQVVVSGNVTIGESCFLGVNATIRNAIRLGEKTLVGAGAYIDGDTEAKSVYVPPRSIKLDVSSDTIDL